MKPDNLIVLLVEPMSQGNIGAAARAMKNCGLSKLRVIRGARIGKEAKRFATHGADVLAKAKRFPDFQKAIADATRVVGFTSKLRKFGPTQSRLPKIAPLLAKLTEKSRVVLVFGRENHGLFNAEIELCTDLVEIPADPKWPVYNLAQSVLLACYEIAIREKHSPVVRRGSAASSRQVSREAQRRLLLQFEELLPKLAYEKPDRHNRSARMLRRLSRQFDRSLLEHADLEFWLALLFRLQQRL